MSLTRQPSGITIKSEKELELMRRAGTVVAQAKALIRDAIRPGITTGELDKIAEDEIRRAGGTPSFKGYMGVGSIPFSGTICASINHEIVHGIPGSTVPNCRSLRASTTRGGTGGLACAPAGRGSSVTRMAKRTVSENLPASHNRPSDILVDRGGQPSPADSRLSHPIANPLRRSNP